jgi:hypothetical protein
MYPGPPTAAKAATFTDPVQVARPPPVSSVPGESGAPALPQKYSAEIQCVCKEGGG